MASVMTSTIALAPTMHVTMAQVRNVSAGCSNIPVGRELNGNSLMRSANAVEPVKPTLMPMAFVMTWMTGMVVCNTLVRSSSNGCSVTQGDCDCNGNQLDALGIL